MIYPILTPFSFILFLNSAVLGFSLLISIFRKTAITLWRKLLYVYDKLNHPYTKISLKQQFYWFIHLCELFSKIEDLYFIFRSKSEMWRKSLFQQLHWHGSIKFKIQIQIFKCNYIYKLDFCYLRLDSINLTKCIFC